MEDSRVNFDLLDTEAVELAEGGDDACFLAGAGGTVDEEVGEVSALRLRWGMSRGVWGGIGGLTRLRSRSERSSW